VTPHWGSRVGRLLAGYLVIWLAMVGVGLLLTKTFPHVLDSEAGLERDLAAHRDPELNTVTHYVTLIGETITVVAMVAVLAGLLRWWLGRWTESIFLVVAVSGQALVFLCTQLLIERPRPTIQHLDAAPPTSSFPSGHTGAATALWVALAVVAVHSASAPWLRRVLVVAAVVLPLGVACARLYRGMHHPSDVLMGGLNGLACVALAAAVLLATVERHRVPA
jgi:membrane-associated phospholipid phosphatase